MRRAAAALARIVRPVIDSAYTFEGDLDPSVDEILIRELLTAGFRRTVQGEPTQEERDAGLSEAHSESYRLGWRAGRASVQGEPTDAQLSEIERRVYDEHRGEVAGFAKALIRAGWAAALRAAAAVSRGRAEPVSWVIWPREGTSVNVIIRSGKVMLSSADANWYMRKEGQGHG